MSVQYAFDEIRMLASSLSSPISTKDPKVRYMCALVSELAYHHVPQFEIDNKKRAKLIPCMGYHDIIAQDTPTDVRAYLKEREFTGSFVVVERGVIAVGVQINDCLFIGFRGTRFLFDWCINVKASLKQINRSIFSRHLFHSRLHSGFTEESIRVSSKIIDSIRESNMENIDHLFFSGHSLGGAVAAISENLIRIGNVSTIILGSPRYCDIAAYFTLSHRPPTQIRRFGDIVPFMPPRWLGYADHPYEFDTAGNPIFMRHRDRSLGFLLLKGALFTLKCLKPHSMEIYRNELGKAADAEGAFLPIAPYPKLKKKDIED